MEYVTIAKLLKPFGLKGEFRSYSLTSFPKERFRLRTKLTLHNPKTGEDKPVTLSSFRQNGDFLILGFAEIPTIEEAENFLGCEVNIEKENAPLPKDTYRIADLVGCRVEDESGTSLGQIKDVFSYSTTYTIRVKREGAKDFFVPFVDEFVKTVDLEGKRVVVHVIEGML